MCRLAYVASRYHISCCLVSREVELEIELPRGRSWGIFPLFVHEGKAQLDDFQQVHVTTQQLVLIVSVAPEFPDWSGHHAWKLSVLMQETSSQCERYRCVRTRIYTLICAHLHMHTCIHTHTLIYVYKGLHEEKSSGWPFGLVSPVLTYHGDVVILSDDMTDPLQLLLQVVGPNLTYSLTVIHSSCGHNATFTHKQKKHTQEALLKHNQGKIVTDGFILAYNVHLIFSLV